MIWTKVAVSISYTSNHYTTDGYVLCIYICIYLNNKPYDFTY